MLALTRKKVIAPSAWNGVPRNTSCTTTSNNIGISVVSCRPPPLCARRGTIVV